MWWYYVIKNKLDEMQASHSSTKVKAILETAEASREDITRRDVEKLNQRLTDAEIKEVNKLLTWVPVVFGEASIKLCEAILRPL